MKTNTSNKFFINTFLLIILSFVNNNNCLASILLAGSKKPIKEFKELNDFINNKPLIHRILIPTFGYITALSIDNFTDEKPLVKSLLTATEVSLFQYFIIYNSNYYVEKNNNSNYKSLFKCLFIASGTSLLKNYIKKNN